MLQLIIVMNHFIGFEVIPWQSGSTQVYGYEIPGFVVSVMSFDLTTSFLKLTCQFMSTQPIMGT